MKIAVVAVKFPVRSETFIKEHVLGLAKRNHQVTVISCGVGENISLYEIEEIKRTGIKLVNIPCFVKHKLHNWLRIFSTILLYPKTIQYLFTKPPLAPSEIFWSRIVWKVIDKIDPDIIHVHFGMLAASLVRYKMLSKAVVTWHGYDANLLPKMRGDNMYHELFQAQSYHTVGSNFMQQRLEQLGGLNKQIFQIPMGVDCNNFSYKERFFSPIEPMKIVSVGRLHEMKGHTFLVQAVCELINEGSNIELRIIGDGSLRDKLNKQISKNQYYSQITLLGSKTSNEIKSELYSAHLFCLTGIEAHSGLVETQGIVFAEAQSTGLPVIGSNIGGVPDSLIDGQTGLLCSPGNVLEIKQAIRFFLTNRGAINEFGRRGREFIESKFSLDKMADSFENLYQNILN